MRVLRTLYGWAALIGSFLGLYQTVVWLFGGGSQPFTLGMWAVCGCLTGLIASAEMIWPDLKDC